MEVLRNFCNSIFLFLKQLKFRIYLFALLLISIIVWLSLPLNLFDTPYSTIVTDRNGELLGAKIADDGQWRFPIGDSVPEKFKTAILLFEDEYFYYHFGVNPISVIKAASSNIKHKKVVRGASTLTMQTIRLSSPARRTMVTKIVEVTKSIKLEIRHSKDDILQIYCSQAPFGGNTVGLEAASWRYFKRPSHEITWAEAAMLAVLPNAPSLINLQKNKDVLQQKRDLLLKKMLDKGKIDSITYEMSVLEELPEKIRYNPQLAPHLLDYAVKEHKGEYFKSTIDKLFQQKFSEIVNRHSKEFQLDEIYNAAAIVADVESGEILAYIGNSHSEYKNKGGDVDIILSNRSSGSVLKPLLYAFALEEGYISPNSLLPDIPTFYKNFTPQNFQKRYDGAVPASEALSRSLNIPFVRMLDEVGGEAFIDRLRHCGFTTFDKDYSHYGLSLILGGGENNLLELVQCYASMMRTLNYYSNNNSRYSLESNRTLNILQNQKFSIVEDSKPIFSASSIYYTFESMRSLRRPEEESGWEFFTGNRNIAWKTGTSFGNRDAWAVGVNKDYAVAVWVGNATGEGRPAIIGTSAAGPILFEIFSYLPKSDNWEVPHDDLQELEICLLSGDRATPHCEEVEVQLVPITIRETKPCSYHKTVFIKDDDGYVHSEKIFVLPPVMEYYHKKSKISSKFITSTNYSAKNEMLDFIYPNANSILTIPKDLDLKYQKIVFSAVHRKDRVKLFWHLNNNYIGETITSHQMEYIPQSGLNVLSIVDEMGNKKTITFRCNIK